MVGEENRHQMMQNLFGDQSEEEDEEEEVESEHESNRQVDYVSDEGDGGPEPEGEDEVEGEVEGQGEVEIESEGEPQDVDVEQVESEDEKSQEVEMGNQREESEERYLESDDEGYGQRVVTSRRRNTIDSGSERSGENYYAASKDEEVNQARRSSRSPGDEKNEDHLLYSAPEIRDVFGDSDDEEQEEYAVQNQIEEDENRSLPDEEDNFEKGLRPEDMIPDEDAPYESEEEHTEARPKEKPVGPPLELEIPLRHPPADPDKMHMIKVSNIMGIDPKPFDPKTYVEDDVYITDESGSKKRIRLENNIVRWRRVKNPDGTTSVESNARFVEWSDGSLQLLIGNEVLDISKQDAQHEQARLFLRHGKGILQSQGRILTKMKFMPSSLTSNSHRLLTALVDSRHKKVYKVKNCITDIDPEREKEQKEKAVSQSIRASAVLSRKKEKVKSKYTQPIRRERQLSPGFLEDALDEDDDQDYYEPRRSAARRSFEEDLEMEARAEKRIINAKKGPKDIARKSALPSRRSMDFAESEEESEYETEGEEDEGSPSHRRDMEAEQDYEEDVGRELGEEDETYEESEEEAKEPKQRAKQSGGSLKRKDIESDEDSPPRKAATHRRMAIVYDSDEE
ncbi:LEO1 homolog isoform X1 [Olea europaea subsp. europaea]|uniref:LEO1 homolog isoform X1 n=1 Tax=Olea europaea subsp. europaea TaxID=158383 RepID=A0A8S0UG72_OLEEU|nr:LEO1 homolog isoform X1 [Olea europaea subsp. europaea]